MLLVANIKMMLSENKDLGLSLCVCLHVRLYVCVCVCVCVFVFDSVFVCVTFITNSFALARELFCMLQFSRLVQCLGSAIGITHKCVLFRKKYHS